MIENKDAALEWMGLSEGGYVNHPRDTGGATDRGVTQRVYSAWLKSKGRPDKSVRGISKGEANQIFYENYMQPLAFDKLPSGVDYAVSDYGVNSGQSRAARDLQAVVGVKQDGVIGVMTLAAVKALPATEVVRRLCERRWDFVQGLDNFDVFGDGWRHRIMGQKMGVQEGDIGVIDRATRLARKTPVASIPAPTVAAPGKAESREPTAWANFIAALVALFTGKGVPA